jgi:hypothetical protein
VNVDTSVLDPQRLYADPDTAFWMNADPDSALNMNADPDPGNIFK